MKITVSGNITKVRLAGIAAINEKASIAVRGLVPDGLGQIYADKHRQAATGAGRLIQDHAEVHGLTTAQAIKEIKAEGDLVSDGLADIEKTRQLAIVAVNSAITTSEINTIIEGTTYNG